MKRIIENWKSTNRTSLLYFTLLIVFILNFNSFSLTWTTLPSPAASLQGIASNGVDFWCVVYNELKKINPNTGEVLMTLTISGADPGAETDWQGLTLDGDGYLWVVSYATDKAYKINPNTGVVEDSWSTGGPTPIGITYIPFEKGGGTGGDDQDEQFWVSDENGHVYLTETDASRVGYDNGPVPWGPGTSNIYFLNNATNPDHFYVTRFGFDTIRIYNDITAELVLTIDAPSKNIKGITSDGMYLYVSDWSNGRIYRKLLSKIFHSHLSREMPWLPLLLLDDTCGNNWGNSKLSLNSPLNGATSVSNLATFYWEPYSGANGYVIFCWDNIGDNENFPEWVAVVQETSVNLYSYSSVNFINGRTYWWKVRAYCGGSNQPRYYLDDEGNGIEDYDGNFSIWSDVWHFVVEP